ncbi:MAG: dTDP-4-dehydrorhamnose 3,5-epimerase [Alphaproteobacteria bacterium]|nr:dTDP-4-dehydrorhamnose 3,5-epimerase [Alphaproteobacteria bacterium]
MIFLETPLEGARLIDIEKRGDDRGFFARVFCANEFAAQGLETRFVQGNTSLSTTRHTLRGMHFQRPPHEEVKVVRCTRGAIWDAIIDLRPASPTFGRGFGAELTAATGRMMYVPRGFAHGFLSLTEDAEVLYLVSDAYTPGAEGGIRWNDPRFALDWPAAPASISPKDESWPDFDETAHKAAWNAKS